MSAMKDREDAALSQLREAFPVGTPSAGMPLDDACLLRYVRARDGSVPKATAMLNATLQWRREFEVDKVLKEDIDVIAKENSTGKIYVSGFDLEGRPVMVMRPSRENTHDHDGNIKHLVYQMERIRAILQKESGGRGKMCLIIDYSEYSLKNAPPMKTSLASIRILQNHYPETLGVAYFVSPPLLFRGFYKMVYPFIDPVTRQKFVFVPGKASTPASQEILTKNFAVKDLEEAFGGGYKTGFDSSVYLGAPMDQDFRAALAASLTKES